MSEYDRMQAFLEDRDVPTPLGYGPSRQSSGPARQVHQSLFPNRSTLWPGNSGQTTTIYASSNVAGATNHNLRSRNQSVDSQSTNSSGTSSHLDSISSFGTTPSFHAPPPPPLHVGVAAPQMHMVPMNQIHSQFTLRCECNYCGCDLVFSGHDFEDWISHSYSHFGSAAPPPRSRCNICGEVQFDRLSWRKRMLHILDHFIHESTATTTPVVRPDFFVVNYLWKLGKISQQNYDQVTSYHGNRVKQSDDRSEKRSRHPRIVLGDQAEVVESDHRRDLMMEIDLSREDRRRRYLIAGVDSGEGDKRNREEMNSWSTARRFDAECRGRRQKHEEGRTRITERRRGRSVGFVLETAPESAADALDCMPFFSGSIMHRIDDEGHRSPRRFYTNSLERIKLENCQMAETNKSVPETSKAYDKTKQAMQGPLAGELDSDRATATSLSKTADIINGTLQRNMTAILPELFRHPSMMKLANVFGKLLRKKLRPSHRRLEWTCVGSLVPSLIYFINSKQGCGKSLFVDINRSSVSEIARLSGILGYLPNSTLSSPSLQTINLPEQPLQVTNSPHLPANPPAAIRISGPSPTPLPAHTNSSTARMFILPDRTYLEICVNTGGLIKTLSEIDLAHIRCDGELFRKIRSEYMRLRSFKSKLWLFKPCDVHFVKVSNTSHY